MKKIFSMVAVVMLVAALAVYSFAAGAFVESPTGVPAPNLVSATNENVDCIAELKIESYTNRAVLDEASLVKMNAAYASIKATNDISTLSADLAAIADNFGIASTALAVSDLFDISHIGCANHSNCGAFTISIRPNTTEKFVALMHFNGTAWEVVETTLENGVITFTVNDFSPFAIIAHDGTGDAPMSSGAVAGIVGGVVGGVVIIGLVAAIVVVKTKKA